MICTPFTGHPVEGVLLCGTHSDYFKNVKQQTTAFQNAIRHLCILLQKSY